MDLATVFAIVNLIGREAPEFIAIYARIKAALGTDDAAALERMLAEADAAADAQHQAAQAT